MYQGAFAEDLVDFVLRDNKDPTMGLDPNTIGLYPDTIGLDPDTNDVKEEIYMDSFDSREEQNIEIDEGGQFIGVW